MRVPGARTASTSLRRARQWLARQPLILLYHRVATVDEDPWSTCVSPALFAEQLSILRAYGAPLSLSELLRGLEMGRVPRRAVVISFDDGYSDFLHAAKPVLEEHGFPATLFVTTGAIGGDRGFWWDELESLISGHGELDVRLRLNLAGSLHEWMTGSTSAGRQRTLQAIYELLRTASAEDQQRAIGELREQLRAEPRDTGVRALTSDELREVAASGLIEIGAHTVTHPVLAGLPAEIQRREIEASRSFLEDLTGGSVAYFAYPHGARRDFTSRTMSLVREAGFRAACAAFPGVIGRNVDRFQLPRIGMRDWDADSFERRLRFALDL